MLYSPQSLPAFERWGRCKLVNFSTKGKGNGARDTAKNKGEYMWGSGIAVKLLDSFGRGTW